MSGRKNLTPSPLLLRFRLLFSRVRLDAAREILAERGGRAPHTCALGNNRRPHRRVAHVSERHRRSWNQTTVDSTNSPRLRISASPHLRVSARNSASSALSAPSVEIRPKLRIHPTAWVHSPKGANAFLTRRTRRTRRDLNSVAEETSSSKGTKKPSQALSFAFFAPSRETNLLSKFAPFGECSPQPYRLSPCVQSSSPL